MFKQMNNSGLARSVRAMSYGPFGYGQSAVVGFIAGSAAFLVVDSLASTHSVVADLPVLLACSGGATLLLLTAALIANYLIGNRVRQGMELHKAMLARQPIAPPLFDDAGNMLQTTQVDLPRSRRSTATNLEVIRSESDRTDTSSDCNVHAVPELGEATLPMGNNHEHEFPKAASN